MTSQPSAKTPPSLPMFWKELEGKEEISGHPYDEKMLYYIKDVQTAVNECVEELFKEIDSIPLTNDMVQLLPKSIEKEERRMFKKVVEKIFGRN